MEQNAASAASFSGPDWQMNARVLSRAVQDSKEG
jgi:hypothetical protein